jgi:hypothetical protein
MVDDPQQVINEEVSSALALNNQLVDLEQRLSESKEFRKFLELQKTVPARLEATWKQVEQQMIEHDIKSLKGEWGSLTIAERLNWEYDPSMLASKFFKKVVDTKKLSDTFRLEGKEPKGATAKTSKYLMKRLK